MKNYLIIIAVFLAVSIQAQTIESVIKAKPFDISGSIGGNLGLYSVDGIDERTSPFQYGLSARLTFKIYGISIPLYASIRDNTFNYGGSFNRLRITPQYKWVKVHLGDTYLKFNPYTLNGRTVNGYGVTLTPGNFRFSALRGRVEDLRSFQDSLQLGTTFVPTYTRRVNALSIGFGSSSTYFDLYAVNSADQLDSLNGEVVLEDFTRQSNTAFGSTLAIKIAQGLRFRTNFGISLQTQNLDSFGDNTTVGNNGFSGSIVEANITSRLLYAGDVGLNYSNRLFSLNGKVKYIQPFYQPLTVAFINSDILNYTIGGSTGFFKRKLNISGNIGIQKNNLTGSKLSTTNSVIANLAANFRLGKSVSGTFTYTNFAQDFEARLIQINDLFTYAVNSNVLSGSMRYSLKRGDVNYRVSLRGGRNGFITVSDAEESLVQYDSWNTGLTLGRTNSVSDFSINSTISYRKYNRETGTLANYGGRISLSKGFLDSKLKLTANSSFIFNDRDELREGTTFRNGLAISYSLDKKGNIGLRANQIRRSSAITSDFTELRGALQYQYTF